MQSSLDNFFRANNPSSDEVIVIDEMRKYKICKRTTT